ncbi:MAG TPA: ferritin-like domain-containing protein [Longimicrobiales bacterium]
MAEPRMQSEASLVAELNDLLQLDHDAVQAYNIAIDCVSEERLREPLMAFRADHERHIQELTSLIRAQGGIPLEIAHIPTGMFKSAVQRAGATRGDRALLLTFKANERQVRDKYRRHADRDHPPDVQAVLARAALDEERHYAWALEVLDELCAGEDTIIGRIEAGFERGHKAVADAVENVERGVMERMEEARRGVMEAPARLRSAAGDRLERAAGAVDRVGDWAGDRGGVIGRVSPVAHGVAGGFERAAGYVRTRDFAAMRSDVERGVDRHPLRAALIALGIGFLFGRIVR